MVSQTYASFLLSAVFCIVEISLVNCNLFSKCCASDEGLLSIRNSTTEKYICSSEFDENVIPLMFKNLNNVEFGIPQGCGTKSCIDKTVDGEKLVELLCANKEKILTTDIPNINKCCPWNSSYNATEKMCYSSETYDDSSLWLYDIESEAYNVIIRNEPQCKGYVGDNYLEYNDFTISNGKLIIHFEHLSISFEKETYCFDLRSERYKNKIFVRNCMKTKVQNTDLQTRKCCEHNELLQTVNKTYECTSNISKIMPLKTHLNENITIGIPKTCGTKTCIDKKMDQTIVELFCDKKEKHPLVKLPTIFKCCPLNMYYEESTKSCVEDYSSDADLIFDTSAPMYNLIIGVPNCRKTKAFVDYRHEGDFSINNGTLILDNSTTFENGSYCIDRRRTHKTLYIRKCGYAIDSCRDRPCVPKCCAPGQSLFTKEKSECIEDFNTPFYSNFTNSLHEDVGIPENLGIISSVLNDVQCSRYMNKKFRLDENGTLYGVSTKFKAIDQRYCIEYYGNTKTYITLICFNEPKVTGLHNFVYLVGLLISIIFLAITVTIYFFLPDLQNLHGRTVMSHSTSLLASYIILAMVKRPLTSYTWTTCVILGYGIMYTFLVAFAWLNVMCFDIWYTFGVVKARGMKKHKDLKKFLLYSLYAYGIPLIITGITLYIDLFADVPQKFKPKFAYDACWFDLRPGRNILPYSIFFAIPVASIIFFNIVLFTLTVRHCLKVRGDIQRMQHADSPKKRRFFADKATVIMNFKLFIVMGISWIFEVMSMYVRNPPWLWYILDSINVLQGLWIFCIFVLKANVWKALKKKLGYSVLREGSQTQSTALTAKNSIASTTSLRINGIAKPEERDLLHNAIRNSINSAKQ